MKTPPVSRSLAIMKHLATCQRPVNSRQVRDAVDPSCDLASFRNSITVLAGQGKVERVTTGRGNTTYRLLPGALVDRRSPIGRAIGEPVNPVCSQHVIAPTTPAAPSALAKAQHHAELSTKPINTQRLTVANANGGAYLASKRKESEKIAQDLAAFETAGGLIQRLDIHASSRPLNFDYRTPQQIAASARGGYATQARIGRAARSHTCSSTTSKD